ncbi:MAG TPA: hypothetical protein VIG75_09295 [Citricoccus sp.]
MSTGRTSLVETVQACLIGIAIACIGTGLLIGDIVIPRSTLGGVLLLLAGVCYLASALMSVRRRSPHRQPVQD